MRLAMRDHMLHHFDPVARTLQIDFALHQPACPATDLAVQVGQTLGVGGPRDSLIVPTECDWHLRMGDTTALPAITRRLAELRAGGRAEVLIEVKGPDDHNALPSAATFSVHGCTGVSLAMTHCHC